MSFEYQSAPILPADALSSGHGDDEVFPLPDELRRKADRFFGGNFSAVRVHLGLRARELGCDALACGSRLYFAPGRYAPSTPDGAHAVMHELAHLAQQRQGRVQNTTGRGIAFVNDSELEAEADRFAAAALAGVSGLPSGCGETRHGLARVAQPLVTVGAFIYSKNGGKGKDFDAIWSVIGDHFARIPKSQRDEIKTKLKHWVNADKRGGMFGKGHAKSFSNDFDLMRALIGQIQSQDSKAYERKLAKKVQESNYIRRHIRDYIRGPLKKLQSRLAATDDKDEADLHSETRAGGKDAARYAFYYSPIISGIARGKQRSLYEGMKKFEKSSGTVSAMSAFVADYSMIARDLYSEDDYPYILPQEDSRANNGGFNVDESSEWVRRARLAKVRLGAGSSATTMNVLRVARAILGTGPDADDTMLCLSLGLFCFWNLEMDKLKSFAEIHTFHEVMVVAYGYGLPCVPSLTGGPSKAAEFDYPMLKDIPA